MDKRPLSVTIIAWFLIVTSIFNAFTIWTSFDNPIGQQILAQSPFPRSAHVAFAAFSLALNFAIGVALLKRQNWARYVYVGFGLFGIVIAMIATPLVSVLLLSAIVLGVIAFFLFRKPASEWFRGAAS